MCTQLGTCRVKLMHKNVEMLCSFFPVPGNSPSLIGMPDCERLQLLIVNCNTIDLSHRMDKEMNSQNKISPKQIF